MPGALRRTRATGRRCTAARLSSSTQILKGTKPGEIPFEQGTKLELVVKLKGARALGITIPKSVLLSADAVIESRHGGAVFGLVRVEALDRPLTNAG